MLWQGFEPLPSLALSTSPGHLLSYCHDLYLTIPQKNLHIDKVFQIPSKLTFLLLSEYNQRNLVLGFIFEATEKAFPDNFHHI